MTRNYEAADYASKLLTKTNLLHKMERLDVGDYTIRALLVEIQELVDKIRAEHPLNDVIKDACIHGNSTAYDCMHCDNLLAQEDKAWRDEEPF